MTYSGAVEPVLDGVADTPPPNRTIWPAMSVPIAMVPAQAQSGGGTIATGSFSTSGAWQLISVAASGSASVANSLLGVDVSVDQQSLGSLSAFANVPNFGVALTPRRVWISLAPGAHTVTLTANAATVTGSADRVVVSVIDLGDNPELLRSRGHYFGDFMSKTFMTCGGATMLWVAASGWSTSAGQMTGASVLVDGTQVACSVIYANSAQTHLSFVPVQIVLPNLAPGRHTLEVLPVSGTTSDANDRCAIEVLEFTAPPQVLTPTTPIANAGCTYQEGGQTVASGTFSTLGGTVLLRAMASAWTRASSSPLNLAVSVDGTARGTVTGFASSADLHVPLVPADILVAGLAGGQHTVTLTADANTVTDGNDRCTVSVLELATSAPV